MALEIRKARRGALIRRFSLANLTFGQFGSSSSIGRPDLLFQNMYNMYNASEIRNRSGERGDSRG